MRVIKSLLLGAAAGLAATAGVQAADMPVKAKAVEYVKICSAYGAGFYYIPGTDICLRVGGYVYLETGVKGANAVANIYSATPGPINSDYNYMNWRTSARVNLDARQNTAYGTLRAFMSTGGNFNANHTNITSWDAAYIQFAGFTWGYTNSFFSFAGPGYTVTASPMTDWSWINVFAYTAQLGNGLTASLSAEDPRGRRAGINSVVSATGTVSGNSYGGSWAPDVVANFNVTQAWGRAQIMGAAHQVKVNKALINTGADSDWGWAVGAGVEIKTPQTGNPNNSWIVQGAYTEGAVDYIGYNSSPTASNVAMGIQQFNGLGPNFAVNDAISVGGVTQLTEAWSVYTAYRHYWTPMLRTAFTFGYLEIEEGSLTAQGSLEVMQAGIGTVWSPVAGLDLSLDVVWSDLEQTLPAAGGTLSNDIITVWSRLRWNF
jgi:Porin subfamily